MKRIMAKLHGAGIVIDRPMPKGPLQILDRPFADMASPFKGQLFGSTFGGFGAVPKDSLWDHPMPKTTSDVTAKPIEPNIADTTEEGRASMTFANQQLDGTFGKPLVEQAMSTPWQAAQEEVHRLTAVPKPIACPQQ